MDDSRFAKAGVDPRYKRSNRKKGKVKIDGRFAAALTDDRFGVATAPVDKYGRPEEKRSRTAELAPFYEVDDDAKLQALQARARGEDDDDDDDGGEAKDDDEESSSDEDDDGGDDGPEAWDAGLPATHEEASEVAPSKRLAFLDLDWSHVRATDVLAIAQSLCPPGGTCVAVHVYASTYGVEAMEEEKRFGPRRDVFDQGDDEVPVVKKTSTDEVTSGFDPEALRRYELSKLRRFFAVTTFDSPRTADHVYGNDGVDIEATSTPLSLAVIEDAQAFDDARLRDSATADTMRTYEPPPAYCLSARQQTNIECTWDADEPERKSTFDRAFQDADEANLHAYLADSDDDDDDDDIDAGNKDHRRRLLRAQLGLPMDDDDDDDVPAAEMASEDAGSASKKKKKKATTTEDPPPGDVEMAPADAFDDGSSYAADDEAPKRRKRRTKAVDEPADDFFVTADADDDDDDDDEDDADDRDYDAKKLVKATRLSSKAKLRGKRKRQRDALLAETAKSGFEFDANDVRFRAALDGHETFGVDPTSPDYKETPAMKTLLAEQTKRRRARRTASHHHPPRAAAKSISSTTTEIITDPDRKVDAILKSLSPRLLRKTD